MPDFITQAELLAALKLKSPHAIRRMIREEHSAAARPGRPESLARVGLDRFGDPAKAGRRGLSPMSRLSVAEMESLAEAWLASRPVVVDPANSSFDDNDTNELDGGPDGLEKTYGRHAFGEWEAAELDGDDPDATIRTDNELSRLKELARERHVTLAQVIETEHADSSPASFAQVCLIRPTSRNPSADAARAANLKAYTNDGI